LAKTSSFVSRRIIVRHEKNLESRRSWMNPLNMLQEAILCSFIKLRIYCFFLLYEFFVNYALRVEEKSINMFLMRDVLEFQFLRPRGCVTDPFRTLSLCFGVTGKTPDLIPRNNFVKDVFLLPRVEGCSFHRNSETQCGVRGPCKGDKSWCNVHVAWAL
jgi:hypothetical protein